MHDWRLKRWSVITEKKVIYNTPTILGTAEAGTLVQLFDGNQFIGNTRADSTGKWLLTTNELSDGTRIFTAIATDIAGNVSSRSLPLNIVIDTVNPVINLTNSINTGSNAIL